MKQQLLLTCLVAGGNEDERKLRGDEFTCDLPSEKMLLDVLKRHFCFCLVKEVIGTRAWPASSQMFYSYLSIRSPAKNRIRNK
jgi:hypothetical protein